MPFFPEVAEDVGESQFPELGVLFEPLHKPFFETISGGSPKGHPSLDFGSLGEHGLIGRQRCVSYLFITCRELREGEID